MDDKLLRGAFPAKVSFAAAIADAISRGHRTYNQIQHATEIPNTTLARHLAALVSAGVLSRDGREYHSPRETPARELSLTVDPHMGLPLSKVGVKVGVNRSEFAPKTGTIAPVPAPRTGGRRSGPAGLKNFQTGPDRPDLARTLPRIAPDARALASTVQRLADLVPAFDPSPYVTTSEWVRENAESLPRLQELLAALGDPSNARAAGQIRNRTGWLRAGLDADWPPFGGAHAPALGGDASPTAWPVPELPPITASVSGVVKHYRRPESERIAEHESIVLSTRLLELEMAILPEARALGLAFPVGFRDANFALRQLAMGLRRIDATAQDLPGLHARLLEETPFPANQVPIESLIRYVHRHGRPDAPLLLASYRSEPSR